MPGDPASAAATRRRRCILLLGGVHAREWGSPDILLAFAERLLSAWRAEKGIAIGKRRFRAPNVQRLVEDPHVHRPAGQP